MRKFKMIGCGLTLMLAVSGCASLPSAPPPAVACTKPAPPPAWVMEPAPNLIQLLDRIISPYALGSSK